MGEKTLCDAIVESGTIIHVDGRIMQLKTDYFFTVPASFVNDSSKCHVMDDPNCWVDRMEVGL